MAESEAESVPSFTAQKQNFRSTNAAKAEKEKEKQKPRFVNMQLVNLDE